MNIIISLIIFLGSFSLYAKNYWEFQDAPNYQLIKLTETLKSHKPQKQVTIAIIDTGIDEKSPLFKNTLLSPEGPQKDSFGIDFSTKNKSFKPQDHHGHGTHIAGIIKTIAPQAKFLVLKYYNPKASGLENLRSTIKALRYAVNQNVDIINYSGGGPESSPEELALLKQAREKGILVVAAAGNESSDIDNPGKKYQQYFPANYSLENIITVNSIDKKRKIIASSNWGEKSIDIAAPGYKIKSTFYGQKLALMTGTSQATAFVTGVAALIKSQFPHFNYSQIKEALMKGVSKSSYLVKKNLTGGYLNAQNSLLQAREIAKKLKSLKRSVAKKK